MDVQELKKLDAYLKRLFGNARIRVVPKQNDCAEVFVGRRTHRRHLCSTKTRMTTALIQFRDEDNLG